MVLFRNRRQEMPFDGSMPNTKAVAMIDGLLRHYSMHRDCVSNLDLAADIKAIRLRLKITCANTRRYILKAAGLHCYGSLTLQDLDIMILDYKGLENILLRARDLASGEPMLESTWFRARSRICNCTPGRAGFLRG